MTALPRQWQAGHRVFVAHTRDRRSTSRKCFIRRHKSKPATAGARATLSGVDGYDACSPTVRVNEFFDRFRDRRSRVFSYQASKPPHGGSILTARSCSILPDFAENDSYCR